MAKQVTEADDLTSCPVCFEDFSAEGSSVPRILPCFHTLCEHCVEHLLRNNSLECPECRQKHDAPRGVKTFQQNKYTIAYLRNNRKSPPEVAVSQERGRCPFHGENMTMFCRENGCGKAICHLCFLKSHKFHDLVDLEEERKEKYTSLVKEIEEVSKLLMENKKTITLFQENLENQYEKSLIMLKNRKEEVVRIITEQTDRLGEKLCEYKTGQDLGISYEMEAIEINIALIQSLQDDLIEMKDIKIEDIKVKSEMVDAVYEEIRKRNTNKTDTFLEYHTDQIRTDTLENLCGKTTKRAQVRGHISEKWTSPERASGPDTAGQIQHPGTWKKKGLFRRKNREVRGQVREPAVGLYGQVSSPMPAPVTNGATTATNQNYESAWASASLPNTTVTAKILEPIPSSMSASRPNTWTRRPFSSAMPKPW